eukprot:3018411-Lingulodinium_polyedra.AAC.1
MCDVGLSLPSPCITHRPARQPRGPGPAPILRHGLGPACSKNSNGKWRRHSCNGPGYRQSVRCSYLVRGHVLGFNATAIKHFGAEQV